jgi:hypothetical protein
MIADIYDPDPPRSDNSDSDSSDSDSDELKGVGSVGKATKAEVVDEEDATFDGGINVPGASGVTTYLHLKEHFAQQPILLKAFLNLFRNCSLTSSRS